MNKLCALLLACIMAAGAYARPALAERLPYNPNNRVCLDYFTYKNGVVYRCGCDGCKPVRGSWL